MVTYLRDCEYHMAECMVLHIKSTKCLYGDNQFFSAQSREQLLMLSPCAAHGTMTSMVDVDVTDYPNRMLPHDGMSLECVHGHVNWRPCLSMKKLRAGPPRLRLGAG